MLNPFAAQNLTCRYCKWHKCLVIHVAISTRSPRARAVTQRINAKLVYGCDRRDVSLCSMIGLPPRDPTAAHADEMIADEQRVIPEIMFAQVFVYSYIEKTRTDAFARRVVPTTVNISL